jgi:hypothetical protein
LWDESALIVSSETISADYDGKKIETRHLKTIMRKNIVITFAAVFCLACNNGKVDEQKLDAAGDKLKKTVEKGADSVEAKLKRLKNKIDTARRDTSRL